MTDLLILAGLLALITHMWAYNAARDAETIVHPELAAIMDAATSYIVSRAMTLVYFGLVVAYVA